jgi:hypothetical protein
MCSLIGTRHAQDNTQCSPFSASRSLNGISAREMWCSMWARAALAHSTDMATKNYFEHNSLDGSTVLDRIRRAGWTNNGQGYAIGENIAGSKYYMCFHVNTFVVYPYIPVGCRAGWTNDGQGYQIGDDIASNSSAWFVMPMVNLSIRVSK